ncbi:hypothetical protein QOT17_021103 [Balamuthia mandrillaris]
MLRAREEKKERKKRKRAIPHPLFLPKLVFSMPIELVSVRLFPYWPYYNCLCHLLCNIHQLLTEPESLSEDLLIHKEGCLPVQQYTIWWLWGNQKEIDSAVKGALDS